VAGEDTTAAVGRPPPKYMAAVTAVTANQRLPTPTHPSLTTW